MLCGGLGGAGTRGSFQPHPIEYTARFATAPLVDATYTSESCHTTFLGEDRAATGDKCLDDGAIHQNPHAHGRLLGEAKSKLAPLLSVSRTLVVALAERRPLEVVFASATRTSSFTLRARARVRLHDDW